MEPVIDVRRAAARFVTTTAWSQTRHQFSFGDHYDPTNVGHGRLLVSNDDVVKAATGYDPHPHRDVEIITWVLAGSLVHKDSSGRSGIVHRGLAQRLSAGSGIVHSERNDVYPVGADQLPEPAHFVQMWLRPDISGVVPSYDHRGLALADLDRGWVPVASGHDPEAAVSLGSHGSTLWVTVVAPTVRRVLPVGALAHVYVASGAVEVESVGDLRAGDSLQLTGEAALAVTARADAELLVWTMAS